ncbi:MAG: saccharopine dehydrogenase NADP-binding domain-containing protein [Gammaproteobacteria bacterium]
MNKENTSNTSDFDLVIWGASGFTGRLVAEYLLGQYGVGGELRWAMAGRNQAKLETVRDGLGQGSEAVPILLADSHDPDSLEALVNQTRVICSSVGPFAKYGSELVAACVRTGTHYCDITGETQWIRRMIDAHEDQARASGARIVNCCGFDSIPSDLGCLFINQSMQTRHGTPCDEVKMRVRRMRGAFSGGTFASMLNAVEEARRDPQARKALGNPYGLNPRGETSGPDGSDQSSVKWDADVDSWTAPFVMAAINTRVVRRSNAVMDYAYGRDFRYSEAVMTGRGAAGWARAVSITAALGGFLLASSVTATRALVNKLLPDPGEGPSAEDRERGFFDIVMVGKAGDRTLRARVKADRDPGYGATCKMLGESAVCLALDESELTITGGFWTPAAAMGAILIARLENNAGMSFTIEAD